MHRPVDNGNGRKFDHGARQYLVRWEGYDAEHDTWGPMENLVG